MILGTIGAVDKDNGLTLVIDGEEDATEKKYSYLASYTPKAGDRVLIEEFDDTYVIVGKLISSTSEIGIVEKAKYAETAGSAETAKKADSATSATSATRATSATTAGSATSASSATTAGTATAVRDSGYWNNGIHFRTSVVGGVTYLQWNYGNSSWKDVSTTK